MTGPVPPDVVSAADYERYARETLPADVWAYIAGAGADGVTQRRNRAAFDGIELAGRVLGPMGGASTATAFLGIDLPFPLLLAPVAHQLLVHPDGELATALGAATCGAAMCVSTLAGVTLEEIAARGSAPLIFQLYMQGRREATLSLVRRAEDAGYRALMVTVDAPVSGPGFGCPPMCGPSISRAWPGRCRVRGRVKARCSRVCSTARRTGPTSSGCGAGPAFP
jgi:4-hydroxymandelate oxidase